MNKKTVTHRNIKREKIWRNFFLLYTFSLAALYVTLTLTSNTQQLPFHGTTGKTDTVTSETGSNAKQESQLASYETSSQ